jgi:hypothetical protein
VIVVCIGFLCGARYYHHCPAVRTIQYATPPA